jgi:Ca2+-binding EF-hand superfamily protein
MVDDKTPTDAPPADDTTPTADGDPTNMDDHGECPAFGWFSVGRAVERLFTILDTNENGSLTSDEIPASLMEALAPIDANMDGELTLEEIQDSRPNRTLRGFAFLDDNSDGFLTEDEVNADIWARLSPADASGDGAVSEEELATYRDSLPPRGFRRLDDNGDGLITQDEVNEMIWTILVDFDTDDVAGISPEEFPEFSFGHRGGGFLGFGGFRGFRFGFHFG